MYIHVRYIPLQLWNPVWKPRKELLRSIIRAKKECTGEGTSDRSDAAGPLRPQKFIKCSPRVLIIFHHFSNEIAKNVAIVVAICAETCLTKFCRNFTDHPKNAAKCR